MAKAHVVEITSLLVMVGKKKVVSLLNTLVLHIAGVHYDAYQVVLNAVLRQVFAPELSTCKWRALISPTCHDTKPPDPKASI